MFTIQAHSANLILVALSFSFFFLNLKINYSKAIASPILVNNPNCATIFSIFVWNLWLLITRKAFGHFRVSSKENYSFLQKVDVYVYFSPPATGRLSGLCTEHSAFRPSLELPVLLEQCILRQAEQPSMDYRRCVPFPRTRQSHHRPGNLVSWGDVSASFFEHFVFILLGWFCNW